MAGARPFLSLVAIILLAGGIVLQFFVILSGAVKGTPENLIYFLQTTTAGIAGSGTSNVPNPARWTYFAICGVDAAGKNANCGKVVPALPFDLPKNFGTSQGVPHQFLHTTQYYYLSRFMFAFYLIALFFAVVGLLMSVLALCTRLGAKFTGLMSFLAFLFQGVTASLMTAWTVLGRDALKKNGYSAKLGKYGYAFTWSAFVAFLLSTILFCIGGGGKSKRETQGSSYFGRKRSTRSRGSFIDSESGRRVKDEYE